MHTSYLKVFLTFARNSLVRDMSFRMNFVLQCLSSASWALMNFGLFKIIYRFTDSIGKGTGWGESEFFIFLGTIWIINSVIQTFVMANATEFSEMIRTGNLDFALLKPIDTQFLISFPRVNWAQLGNAVLGILVVIYYVRQLMADPEKNLQIGLFTIISYLFFLLCGVLVMYSMMIVLVSDQHLAGAQPESAYLLVLHHQFLPIPHGNLSTRRNRLGTVGNIHLRGPHSGCFERTGASSRTAFTRHALGALGMVFCCLGVAGNGIQPLGQPLGFQTGTT